MKLIVGLACSMGFALNAGASSPVVADATNHVLGFYTGPEPQGSPPEIVVTSTKGFRARFDAISGEMLTAPPDPWGRAGQDHNAHYFPTSDCSGQRYVSRTGESFSGGVVEKQLVTNLLFYIPRNPQTVTFTNASRIVGGVCSQGKFTDGPFIPAFPNDPEVTGFDNYQPVGPLKIEVAEITSSSFDLFRDGFEGAFVETKAQAIA